MKKFKQLFLSILIVVPTTVFFSTQLINANLPEVSENNDSSDEIVHAEQTSDSTYAVETWNQLNSAAEFYDYFGVVEGTPFTIATYNTGYGHWNTLSAENASASNTYGLLYDVGSGNINSGLAGKGMVVEDSTVSNKVKLKVFNHANTGNSTYLSVATMDNSQKHLVPSSGGTYTEENSSFIIYVNDKATVNTADDELVFNVNGTPSANQNQDPSASGGTYMGGGNSYTKVNGNYYSRPWGSYSSAGRFRIYFHSTVDNLTVTSTTSTTTTLSYEYYDYTYDYSVEYSINDGAWTSVPTTPTTTGTYTITIPTTVGQIYNVKIRTNSLYIDEEVTFTSNDVSTVSNVSVSNVTDTSATVNYTYVDSPAAVDTVYYSLNGGSWVVGNNNHPQESGNYSFNITGLDSNTDYTLRLCTDLGDVSTIVSTSFSTVSDPAEITNMSVYQIDQTSATFVYTLVQNDGAAAVRYRVTKDEDKDGIADASETATIGSDERGWTSAPGMTPGTRSITTTTLGLTLTAGTSYVVEFEVDGVIQNNAKLAFSTNIINAEITNTKVTGYSGTEIDISFDYAKNGAAGLLEYRVTNTDTSTIAVPWTSISSPTTGTNTFKITGLTVDTNYKIEFRLDGSVVNAATLTVKTTTGSDPTLNTITTSNVTETSATIEFVADSTAVTGNAEYRVYQTGTTAPTSWVDTGVNVTGAATYSFNISGLSAGTNYTVDVRDASGAEVAEDTASFRTQSTQTEFSGLTITEANTYSAIIEFNMTRNMGSGVVEYSINNGAWNSMTAVEGANTFTINGLTRNTSNTIRIRVDGVIRDEYTFVVNTANDIADFSTLTIRDISTSTVKIDYNIADNDGQGNMQYSINGGTTWISDDDGYIEINNLQSSTQYTITFRIDNIVVETLTFTTDSPVVGDVTQTPATKDPFPIGWFTAAIVSTSIIGLAGIGWASYKTISHYKNRKLKIAPELIEHNYLNINDKK